MPPIIALLICAVFIIILLSIEYKQNPSVSAALWIPTLWLIYCGSKPVGVWFEYRTVDIEAGSPYDRIALSALILFAIYILKKRKVAWGLILKENSVLMAIFVLAGLSILWSDFSFLSLKRWIRLAGVIPVSLVILSEKRPVQAFESILRRCAYILIPLSVILIKYFPKFGRDYSWGGDALWTGVTLTKNMLGQLCSFSTLFFMWAFLRKIRGERFSRGRLLTIADSLVLAIALYLLVGSDSVTSMVAMLVGIASMLFLYGMRNNAKRVAVIIICGVAFSWIILIVGVPIVGEITQAIGRDPTFTMRADTWPLLFKAAARHPLFGAGYGGYFNTPGNEFSEAYGHHYAHNGLLMIYVELGILGVIILIRFYLAAFKRFRWGIYRYFDNSVFGICLLAMSWFVGFAENIFLYSSSFPWSITIYFVIVLSRASKNTEDQKSTHEG